MTPAVIIERAAADGVRLALSPVGTIKATGDHVAVNRWLPIIREQKPGIVAALREAANDEPLPDPAAEARRQSVLAMLAEPEVFAFSPPGDPANDTEALAERVAIMIEGNGWDEVTALREARWQADRERCWRAFLRNAARVMQAPRAEREQMLDAYRIEASRRYGEATGRDMALSLRGWVLARGVH